jgi:hypothetical protein
MESVGTRQGSNAIAFFQRRKANGTGHIVFVLHNSGCDIAFGLERQLIWRMGVLLD